MAKLAIKKGSTDVSLYVFIADSSVATGSGKTGLVYNTASLVCYYVRPLGSAAALALATQTVTGAHSDGGFVEVDATNMPGVYRLDLSDAIVASGVNSVVVMLKGASNMAPVVLEIDLVAYDPQDTVRLGLTALPNVASGSAGAIITAGTGTAQLSVSSGRANADITHIATAAVSTSTAQLGVNVVNFGGSAGTFASGRPEVNTTHWGGTAVASAVVPCNAIQISGDATAADNLEAMLDGTGGVGLTLNRLLITRADTTIPFQVTNSGGAAVKFESTGGNGNGLWLLGHGTNEGLQVDGGATGHGAIITGGASGSGHGLVAQGGASGDGLFAQGGSTTGRGITAQAQAGTTIHGMYVAGFGGGDGLYAVGAGNGSGLHCVAGASGTGDGIEAEINGGSGVPIRGAITGNITGSVGSIASGGITSSSFAAGAITAAVIATDAIDADALAADAIAEINATVDQAFADYDGPTNAEMEARTIVAANYALEATLTSMKGATFNASTDSLEALRDRGDAAWVTGSGGLDAAGVRAAVGLGSANLDTQLADIPTVAEFEARTIVAANYATAASIAALPDAAAINAQVLDVLTVDTFAEPSSVPAATATIAGKIGWLAALARNKVTQTATTQTLRNDADDANIATAAHADDGTTHTRSEWT